MSAPTCCVIDTNVPVTANGKNHATSLACNAGCARALMDCMREGGHVFIDDGGLVVTEYRKNLSAKGEPGPGDAFLRWLLTNEHAPARVTRVSITPKQGFEEDFEETPEEHGVRYDPSDRKFLAVSAAASDTPPILQAFDSKWWGWQESLAKSGVTIHFLCKDEIAAKHAKKTGAKPDPSKKTGTTASTPKRRPHMTTAAKRTKKPA